MTIINTLHCKLVFQFVQSATWVWFFPPAIHLTISNSFFVALVVDIILFFVVLSSLLPLPLPPALAMPPVYSASAAERPQVNRPPRSPRSPLVFFFLPSAPISPPALRDCKVWCNGGSCIRGCELMSACPPGSRRGGKWGRSGGKWGRSGGEWSSSGGKWSRS